MQCGAVQLTLSCRVQPGLHRAPVGWGGSVQSCSQCEAKSRVIGYPWESFWKMLFPSPHPRESRRAGFPPGLQLAYTEATLCGNAGLQPRLALCWCAPGTWVAASPGRQGVALSFPPRARAHGGDLPLTGPQQYVNSSSSLLPSTFNTICLRNCVFDSTPLQGMKYRTIVTVNT